MFVKVITDLEIIGDEAEKIGRYAETLASKKAKTGMHLELQALAEQVSVMLNKTLDSFARMDAVQALEVVALDVRIDEETRWPVIEQGINSALKCYSEHGYTESAGDWVPEYRAVGVPLKLIDGTILSFNCGGYADRVTPELLEQMGQKLKLMTTQLLRAHGEIVD